jgi:hypothetical protein
VDEDEEHRKLYHREVRGAYRSPAAITNFRDQRSGIRDERSEIEGQGSIKVEA